MGRPDFVVKKGQRTSGGSLELSVLELVRSKLLQGWFVLLPSDTCYSLGALPIGESTRVNVNTILERNLGPMSLAFGSYPQVQRFVEVNEMIALLLKRFTPGPITIVCKAKEAVSEDFLTKHIGSSDRTIGVRIPDSHTERDIAACTDYPLMTVAVRDLDTGEEIRDFRRAVEVVTLGIEKLGGAGWAAIESDFYFRDSHSTVIRVSDSDIIELLRQGDIPFASIEDYINGKGKHLLNAGTLSRVVSFSSPLFPTAVPSTKTLPSQEDSTRHREWFWNAFALGMMLLATYFFGGIFVAFWLCCVIAIYLAPWFRAESQDQRFVNKGIILTVVSFLVFIGWEWRGKQSLFIPDPPPSQTPNSPTKEQPAMSDKKFKQVNVSRLGDKGPVKPRIEAQ